MQLAGGRLPVRPRDHWFQPLLTLPTLPIRLMRPMASPPRTPRRTSGYSEVPLPLNIVTGAIPQLLNDFETFVNAANASRQSVVCPVRLSISYPQAI